MTISLKEYLLDEAQNKAKIKPKSLGDGVTIDVSIDDEGYLVLKDGTGNMIFFHPDQIPELKKYLSRVK
jgi:hypothetical protein